MTTFDNFRFILHSELDLFLLALKFLDELGVGRTALVGALGAMNSLANSRHFLGKIFHLLVA